MSASYLITLTCSLVLGTIGGTMMRRARATPMQRLAGAGTLLLISVLLAVGLSR